MKRDTISEFLRIEVYENMDRELVPGFFKSINLADKCTRFNIRIYDDINHYFKYLISCKDNIIVYTHNLKRTGMFIIDYIVKNTDWIQARDDTGFYPASHMGGHDGFYRYTINEVGTWFEITISVNHHMIRFFDTKNIINADIPDIKRSFRTENKSIEILIMHEVLNKLKEVGIDKITIGASCMDDWKRETFLDKSEYRNYFPDLTEVKSIECNNADSYVRNCYHAGWEFLNKKYSGKNIRDTYVYDVNSLFPTMMKERMFPTGKPHFFKGKPEKWMLDKSRYLFLHIRCRFELKEKHFPFLNVDGESNKTNSNVTIDGIEYDNGVQDLWLTQTDFDMMIKNYNITDLTYVSGCWFWSRHGLFDNYIDKWYKVKSESTGAYREIAKMMLNNLYGKFGTDSHGKLKTIDYDKDNGYTFDTIDVKKTSGYVPVAAAITSYSREFIISVAENNYDNLIYSATDSLHLTQPDNTLEVSSSIGKWKKEQYKQAIYLAPKTYAHISDDVVEIKCAGLSREVRMSLEERTKAQPVLDWFKKNAIIKANQRVINDNGTMRVTESDFKLGGI